MLGNLFTVPIHVPGTLAANITVTFTAPVDCQLIHVSANGSNANNGLLTIGYIGSLEAYLASASIGDSDTPIVFDCEQLCWLSVSPHRQRHRGKRRA